MRCKPQNCQHATLHFRRYLNFLLLSFVFRKLSSWQTHLNGCFEVVRGLWLSRSLVIVYIVYIVYIRCLSSFSKMRLKLHKIKFWLDRDSKPGLLGLKHYPTQTTNQKQCYKNSNNTFGPEVPRASSKNDNERHGGR